MIITLKDLIEHALAAQLPLTTPITVISLNCERGGDVVHLSTAWLTNPARRCLAVEIAE